MNWKRTAMIAAAVVGVVLVGIFALRPPNVYIHGIAVSGMSSKEAEAALMERFQKPLDTRVIKYVKNGEAAGEYTFADFGARFNFAPLVEDAVRRRFSLIFRREHNINVLPGFSFDAERLEAVMSKLSRTLDSAVKNASFFEDESGNIQITPEATGKGINTEAAALATREILHSLSDGTVELKIITAEPMYTTADFEFAPVVLGSFGTACCGVDEPRCRNIIRAAERINNSVIYPGEVFSAGEAIGAHLPDSEYEPATIILRGEPAEDIGGGVCQVVTTLYNAVLRAELEVVQRHNHSARVSYVDIGFDATVAGNYFDLKFKNNTPRPVLITARVENKNLEIKIIGHETRKDGREIRFEARQIELLKPEPYREVVDPTIPRGERVVTVAAQMGYHVELFKLVYVGGTEVERIKINTSVYKPLQGVIAIGAG
ncbi:MAG: VanW family protein [Defluviitaleaceae bacterium]|nr:VanW family protein [Defluviitaleaceae bacterium]